MMEIPPCFSDTMRVIPGWIIAAVRYKGRVYCEFATSQLTWGAVGWHCDVPRITADADIGLTNSAVALDLNGDVWIYLQIVDFKRSSRHWYRFKRCRSYSLIDQLDELVSAGPLHEPEVCRGRL